MCLTLYRCAQLHEWELYTMDMDTKHWRWQATIGTSCQQISCYQSNGDESFVLCTAQRHLNEMKWIFFLSKCLLTWCNRLPDVRPENEIALNSIRLKSIGFSISSFFRNYFLFSNSTFLVFWFVHAFRFPQKFSICFWHFSTLPHHSNWIHFFFVLVSFYTPPISLSTSWLEWQKLKSKNKIKRKK